MHTFYRRDKAERTFVRGLVLSTRRSHTSQSVEWIPEWIPLYRSKLFINYLGQRFHAIQYTRHDDISLICINDDDN